MSDKGKSKGQAALEAWAGWIGSFIAFPGAPSHQAILSALWCMCSWFAPNWPVAPYGFVSSKGPGAGKSTFMKVCRAIVRNGFLRPTLRPLSVVGTIQQTGGAVTYFFDQVEALINSKGDVSDGQAILLSGNTRDGGEHEIRQGGRSMSYPTYCQKMFACIGGIARDLLDRCVCFYLVTGAPSRDWSSAVMVREGEARGLLNMLAEVFPVASDMFTTGIESPWAPAWVMPDFLPVGTRARELASPIWSMAVALNLDAATMRIVKQALIDNVKFKETTDFGTYRDLIGARQTEDRQGKEAVQALRDLARVLPERTETASGDISSVRAVELMRGLEDGGWMAYKGIGLNETHLSQLLSRFGVETEPIRMVRGSGGVKPKQFKGYRANKVREAVAKLDGGAGA